MQRLVTAEEMNGIDRRATAEWHLSGAVLMENAGRTVADQIEQEFKDVLARRILVVCGRGNNGGDGFVIARHLANRGALVTCALLGSPAELKGDARTNYDAFLASRHEVAEIGTADELETLLAENELVVDAILGTGLEKPPRGLAAQAIELVDGSGLFTVSVDVPSGVDSNTGAVPGVALHANLTVTMGLAKTGLWLYPGRARVGRVVVADIGIPDILLDGGDTTLLEDDMVALSLPRRRGDGHKGSFGTCLVIAGSRGFSGAACLAGAAAVRSGCGLVRLAVPESISPIVESRVVEPVKHPLPETPDHCLAAGALPRVLELAASCDAVAIGPGIGTSDETRRLLLELLPGLDKPVVVDADGLNLLAGNLEVLRRIRPPVILTPHPGEFSRLTGLAAASINADRIGVCRRFATENGVVLVLKGASTVIAGRDGRVFVNPTGNSGLASGGTGDVLTGLLAGLLAQGMKPFDAAGAAAYIHGMAADIAADDVTEYCLSASDVLDYLPDAFDRLLHPGHDQP